MPNLAWRTFDPIRQCELALERAAEPPAPRRTPRSLEKSLHARYGIGRVVPLGSRLPTRSRARCFEQFPRDFPQEAGRVRLPRTILERRSGAAAPRKVSGDPSHESCRHNRAVAPLQSPRHRRWKTGGERVLPPCRPGRPFRIPVLWRYAESSWSLESVRRIRPCRKPAKHGRGTPRATPPALPLQRRHSPIPRDSLSGPRLPAGAPPGESRDNASVPGCF